MIYTEKVAPLVSYLMIPMYYVEGLLEAQLKNLNCQTDCRLEAVILDPHYRRRDLSSLFKELKYNVLHAPYRPNLKMPCQYDFGTYNSASLLAKTENLCMFSDWRFAHPQLNEMLIRLSSETSFVNIEWQVVRNPNSEYDKRAAGTQLVEADEEELRSMWRTGRYPPSIGELKLAHTKGPGGFNNWGHYMINRALWLKLNGVDEVVTSHRHYADLDLNRRLHNYFVADPEGHFGKVAVDGTPRLSRAMVRMLHHRDISICDRGADGQVVGAGRSGEFKEIGDGLRVPAFDFDYNRSYLKCPDCTEVRRQNTDKGTVETIISKIAAGKFVKLYEHEYEPEFLSRARRPDVDYDHKVTGYQCAGCRSTAETPVWWEKAPHLRWKALCHIGTDGFQIGRDLQKIYQSLPSGLEDRVRAVNASWCC